MGHAGLLAPQAGFAGRTCVTESRHHCQSLSSVRRVHSDAPHTISLVPISYHSFTKLPVLDTICPINDNETVRVRKRGQEKKDILDTNNQQYKGSKAMCGTS